MATSQEEVSLATSRNGISNLSPTQLKELDLEKQADEALLKEPLSGHERRAPFFVLSALGAFVISSCIVFYYSKTFDDEVLKWLTPIPILCLFFLTASFGIWFVLAFTGKPGSRAKQRECYRFAYSFTFTAFIILAFPYLDLWKPDIVGPISLVRGCVNATDKQLQEPIGPRSILCPDSVKSKAINAYPWLLAIGGFSGKTTCINENNENVDCEPSDLTNATRYSEITNGLVVPFYVVFLSFIGGAVSLSRRIPEYQKRSEPDYKPASDLTTFAPMKPYEARESVVFQIMQLISAPFIAITAYWAIAPSTVPASIGLAFVSGFASETILLLIRGVVDGIRPQTTSFVGTEKPGKNPETTMEGGKKDANQVTALVKVRLAVQTDLLLDPGSLTLTVDAAQVPLSAEGFIELPLEINKAHVLVATGRSNSEVLRAEMTITPSADDEGKPFSLNLSRQQQ
jgi:hypothetical protein